MHGLGARGPHACRGLGTYPDGSALGVDEDDSRVDVDADGQDGGSPGRDVHQLRSRHDNTQPQRQQSTIPGMRVP